MTNHCANCKKKLSSPYAKRCKRCNATNRELKRATFYICKHCKKEFRKIKYGYNSKTFCSKECKIRHYQVSCDNCSKYFVPGHPERSKTHTCSISCRGQNKQKMNSRKVKCPNCDKEFIKPNSLIKERNFCNKKCWLEWWAANSKGWISQYGYKYICIDGIEIFEHRYIMEKALNRKLLDNEVVHHINSNRLDNRIENLQIMTKSEHNTHHNIERHN